ncbi:MAG: hypothetical protein ACREF7_03995 [Candidatus Saccharimonadales bacterium]
MSVANLTEWHISRLSSRFEEDELIANTSDLTKRRIGDLVLCANSLTLAECTNFFMDQTDPNHEDDPAFKAAAQICLEVVSIDPPIEAVA